jgi:hypothetical protein
LEILVLVSFSVITLGPSWASHFLTGKTYPCPSSFSRSITEVFLYFEESCHRNVNYLAIYPEAVLKGKRKNGCMSFNQERWGS